MSEPGAGPVPVTMIIAVLDAACDLPALLISIERQRCRPSEVVVTDRGSTDETVTLLQAWAHPSGMRFRVIKAPGASVSEARNLAIEAATFDHIVVTHGAVILDVECVARLWGALTAGGGAAAGQVHPVGRTLLERTCGMAQTPPPGEIDPTTFLPPSTCLAFTRSAWDAVGGYPEWLDAGQDAVFALALRRAGTAITLVPGATVSWSSRQDLRGFAGDSYRTARAAGRAGVVDRASLVGLALGAGGVLAGIVRRRVSPVLLLGAVVIHRGPYLRRAWHSRREEKDRLVTRLAATLGVVLLGDVAAAGGHLVGTFTTRRTDGPTSRWADRPRGPEPGRPPMPPGTGAGPGLGTEGEAPSAGRRVGATAPVPGPRNGQ